MVTMITALCGYFSGTFVCDTGGTFNSDTPGTFVSDIGGTFEVILSFYHTFLEIRERKGSRTLFLDRLIKYLNERMDGLDSK